MRDFLTRLLDRALERGPRLERRVPSLFERSPGAALSGPPLREVASDTDEAERVPAPRARAVDDQAPARPAIAARGDAAAPPREPAASTELRLEPLRIEPDRLLPAPVPQGPSATRPPADADDARRAPAARAASGSGPAEDLSREPRAVRAAPERVIERIVAREARVDRTVIAPPAERRASPAGTASPSRAARAAAARGEPPAAAAEPAPTISVTIGRVEVRAARDPASPPRARREAAPRLTLDDYLRRRSGRDE